MHLEHGDGRGGDLAFDGAAGDVGRAVGFHEPLHDHLVLHLGVDQAPGVGVAAVEQAGQVLGGIVGQAGVQVGGDGVVEVEDGDAGVGGVLADEFGDEGVRVVFAGDGETLGGHARVDEAGHVLHGELLFGPALAGSAGELELLAKAGDGLLIRAEAGGEIAGRDVADVLLHGVDRAGQVALFLEPFDFVLQVEQAQFLDLDAERGDGGQVVVAGFEVARPGAEQADGGAADAFDDLDDVDEAGDAGGSGAGIDHGIGGQVHVAEQVALANGQGGGEQAAQGVAPVVGQGVGRFLGGGDDHHLAGEFLDEDGVLDLGGEVAQVEHGRVAAGCAQLAGGVGGVGARFDDLALAFGKDWSDCEFRAGAEQGGGAPFGEGAREAVSRGGDEPEFDVGREGAEG